VVIVVAGLSIMQLAGVNSSLVKCEVDLVQVREGCSLGCHLYVWVLRWDHDLWSWS